MLPGFILRSHLLGHMSQIETAKFMIFTQVSLFILAAIIIILINLKVKNPTTLEAGRKEPKRYIIPWALLGFCLVMVYQVIISLIYFTIMGSQQTSPNTERLMAIAKKCLFYYFNFYRWPYFRRVCLQKGFLWRII